MREASFISDPSAFREDAALLQSDPSNQELQDQDNILSCIHSDGFDG